MGHFFVDTRTRRCHGPGVHDTPCPASGYEYYEVSRYQLCVRRKTSQALGEGRDGLTISPMLWIPPHITQVEFSICIAVSDLT